MASHTRIVRPARTGLRRLAGPGLVVASLCGLTLAGAGCAGRHDDRLDRRDRVERMERVERVERRDEEFRPRRQAIFRPGKNEDVESGQHQPLRFGTHSQYRSAQPREKKIGS